MEKYGVVSYAVGDVVSDRKLGKGKVVYTTTDTKDPNVQVKFAGDVTVNYSIDGVSKDVRGSILE